MSSDRVGVTIGRPQPPSPKPATSKHTDPNQTVASATRTPTTTKVVIATKTAFKPKATRQNKRSNRSSGSDEDDDSSRPAESSDPKPPQNTAQSLSPHDAEHVPTASANSQLTYATAVAPTHRRTFIKISEKLANKHFDGVKLLPTMATKGSINTTDLHQAFEPKLPWRTAAAFMRAETNNVIRETLRKARRVFFFNLAQGKVLIVASGVSEEITSKTANDVEKKTSYVCDHTPVKVTLSSAEEVQWCVRIATYDLPLLRELVNKINKSNDSADMPQLDFVSSELPDECHIVATAVAMSQLARMYDADVKKRNDKNPSRQFPILPTLSYGILNEFLDNRHAEFKATVAPKFIKGSGHNEASRKLAVLKIAAQLNKMGASTLINGLVIRLMAPETEGAFEKLEGLVDKIVKDGIADVGADMVHPLRRDVPPPPKLKTPEAITIPKVTVEQGKRLAALTATVMCATKLFLRVAESLNFTVMVTPKEGKIIKHLWVAVPENQGSTTYETSLGPFVLQSNEDMQEAIGMETVEVEVAAAAPQPTDPQQPATPAASLSTPSAVLQSAPSPAQTTTPQSTTAATPAAIAEPPHDGTASFIDITSTPAAHCSNLENGDPDAADQLEEPDARPNIPTVFGVYHNGTPTAETTLPETGVRLPSVPNDFGAGGRDGI